MEGGQMGVKGCTRLVETKKRRVSSTLHGDAVTAGRRHPAMLRHRAKASGRLHARLLIVVCDSLPQPHCSVARGERMGAAKYCMRVGT